MGGGVAQAALHMGCNDFGQVMIEENVVSAAGTTFKMDSEEVERHIRDAGFRAARRNMRYQLVQSMPSPPLALSVGPRSGPESKGEGQHA
jgi:cyclic dehypoxanthinyl futalosine synthase